MSQITNSVLIVRPTKLNINDTTEMKILGELDEVITELGRNGVNTMVDESKFKDVDSICSTDWISFHGDGIVGVYPLYSIEKQRLRNESVLEIVEKSNFDIKDIIDYTEAEEEGFFLEGTESVVLDRVNSIAYATISSKTEEELFIEFCEDFEYTPIVFSAKKDSSSLIDYTASVLTICDSFVVIASSLIKDKKERKLVLSKLKESGREIIFVTERQANKFASSIVNLKNVNGNSIVLMSKIAHDSFSENQLEILKGYGELLILDITTIENTLNKSLNSILNLVFLPKKEKALGVPKLFNVS